MKPHFFISSTDGALHDTRDSDWANKPLRVVYCRHFTEIKTTLELKATLRAGPFTDVGGYPLYFITSDGAALSFESVKAELRNVLDSILHHHSDGWRVVGCNVNYEDDSLVCDHSGKRIPSAYGEDDDEKKQVYFVEKKQDRETNPVWRVSVVENGEVIAEDDFYSKIEAIKWVSSHYPRAEKD